MDLGQLHAHREGPMDSHGRVNAEIAEAARAYVLAREERYAHFVCDRDPVLIEAEVSAWERLVGALRRGE